jgi:hypothetical protein
MEAQVWIGTGLFDPFQTFEQGVLSLDDEMLALRRGGDTVSAPLSAIEFGFPLAMLGGGFVMTVRGVRSYVWFYDPFTARNTLLKRFSLHGAQLAGARAWFAGRRAARPWFKVLRPAMR